MKKTTFFLFLLIIVTHVFSQEKGSPVMRTYMGKEYGGHNQVWCAVQDNRGMMYFGNSDGIIEYDGSEWRIIKIPNKSIVRSIAKDSTGRIYVGAVNEFGYLSPDTVGKMSYISLRCKLDTSLQNFKSVWETVSTPDGVFFTTSDFLFRYNNNKPDKPKFNVWKAKESFGVFLNVNNKYYLKDGNEGLFQVIKDSLKLINKNNLIKKIAPRFMLPFGKNRFLLGTFRDGLYVFDPRENIHKDCVIQVYETKLNSFFKKNLIPNGIQLSNGNYAFATNYSGVVITNPDLQIIQFINKKSGLESRQIYSLFEKNDILWITYKSGIASVELDSPYSLWNEGTGIEDAINDIIRFKKRIYISSGQHVYYLDTLDFNTAFSQNSFHKIENLKKNIWEFQKSLLQKIQKKQKNCLLELNMVPMK